MPLIKRIHDEGQLKVLDQRIREIIGTKSSQEYSVEPEVSGISVLLFYENGVLSRAITQGGLHEGEVITPNMKTMLSVPLNIADAFGDKTPPDHLAVWGTVYLEKEAVRRESAYGSVKEAVAAALIRDDIRVTARRPLNIFCHGIERESDLGVDVETHYELMILLQQWGFRINRPHIALCHDVSSLIRTLRIIEERRGEYPYEVDGAVVQVNPMKQRISFRTEARGEPAVIFAFS